MNPLISVIIPAYNSAKTISTAIESMLNQTYDNLEIIVVNDNSQDNTESVVLEFAKKFPNISYHKLPYDDPERFNDKGVNINAGYMARNYGMEKAKGEWITFQDADDASLANRIEAQYNLALEHHSSHICIDWIKYDKNLLNKKLDYKKMLAENSNLVVDSKHILKLCRKTKTRWHNLSARTNNKLPFFIKKLHLINTIFSPLASYPFAGNSPLFRREIADKIHFRKLSTRTRPSLKGRGADRDFNFQVAETFKDSFSFRLPLYLWRVKSDNIDQDDYKKYLIS